MPTYRYKARDEQGRLITGKVDVATEEELRKRLDSSALILVQFSQLKRDILNEDFIQRYLPVTLKQLYTVTLQLANTTEAGVPLLDSLRSIIEGCSSKKLVVALKSIVKDLESGKNFTEALSKHRHIFTEFYIRMVELGETAGTLPTVFFGLADYIKREMEIKRRVILAMIYPAILSLVGTFLVGHILINIMPQFIEVFIQEGIDLPIQTKILIGLSNFIINYWYLMLMIVAVIMISLWTLAKSDRGRLAIDKGMLKLPIISGFIRKICSTRFLDGLYLLYTSGLPILKALEIVKAIVHNKALEQIIDSLGVHISEGKDLASFLVLTDFFSPDIIAMIKTGEESGTLEKMLEKASAISHDEINYAVEGLVALLEVGIILVMGMGVLFVAMAMIFPMYKLSGAVVN